MKSNTTQHCLSFFTNNSCCSAVFVSVSKGNQYLQTTKIYRGSIQEILTAKHSNIHTFQQGQCLQFDINVSAKLWRALLLSLSTFWRLSKWLTMEWISMRSSSTSCPTCPRCRPLLRRKIDQILSEYVYSTNQQHIIVATTTR
jgi:hypothetical protein